MIGLLSAPSLPLQVAHDWGGSVAWHTAALCPEVRLPVQCLWCAASRGAVHACFWPQQLLRLLSAASIDVVLWLAFLLLAASAAALLLLPCLDAAPEAATDMHALCCRRWWTSSSCCAPRTRLPSRTPSASLGSS